MKTCVCSVMDTAVLAFNRPIFAPTVAHVLRSFGDEVNRVAQDNQMHVHSDDFVLYYLADFDEDLGVFSEPEGGKRVLARGKDVRHDAS